MPDTKAQAIKKVITCQMQAVILSYVNFCNRLPTGLLLSSIISLQPIFQNAGSHYLKMHI